MAVGTAVVVGVAAVCYFSAGTGCGAAASVGARVVGSVAVRAVGSRGGVGAGKAFTSGVKNVVKPSARNCEFCGKIAREVDHIVPRTRGGNNTIRNAQPLCRVCNASKGNRNFPKNYPLQKKISWFIRNIFRR